MAHGREAMNEMVSDDFSHQSSCALLFVQAQRSRVNFENLAIFTKICKALYHELSIKCVLQILYGFWLNLR